MVGDERVEHERRSGAGEDDREMVQGGDVEELERAVVGERGSDEGIG